MLAGRVNNISVLSNDIFFEKHPDPMWIYDRDTLNFLAVNESAVVNYGYSREEFLKLTIADVRPADDVAALYETLSNEQRGFNVAGTWRHRVKSGRIIFVSIRSNDLNFNNKKASMVSARDVTLLIEGEFERAAAFTKQHELAQRLTDTLKNLSDGFITMDNDLIFTFINREGEKILNIEHSNILGKSLAEVFPDEKGQSFEEKYRQSLKTGEVVRFTDYYPSPLDKWFEIHAHPGIDGLAVYFRDVTHQRAKEEQLALLEQAVSHLNDVLIITKAEPIDAPDGPFIVFANGAVSKHTGYALEELLGKTPRMLQGPKTQRDRLDAMRKSMEAWQPHRTELINYTKSGEEVWIEIEIVPVADDTGFFTHWVSVQRDITERIRSEEAQRLSNERFETIAKAVNDVVWEWDLATDALWWSEAIKTWFGHDPCQMEHISAWRDNIHQDDRTRVISTIESVIASQHDNWENEYRFARADGTYATVVDRGYVLRDPSGTGVRMIGTMMDVTERRELDARLVHLKKLEALGQLTGGIAHDFNNLLTVIVGNSEILTEQLPVETDLHALAELTLAAAERGAELTNRLLAFGRRQPLVAKLVDVGQLVQGLAPLLRRTLPQNILLEVSSICDPRIAMVDAGQLEAALLNLVINARDGMPEGGALIVRTDNAELDSEPGAENANAGSYIMLSVEDTGLGMNDDTVSHAFDPFFTTKDFGKGSGLGLSMVYGFVRQSSGRVTISTTLGTGTKVAMYFPVVDRPADFEAVEPQPETRIGGEEKILVVEDDAMVRTYVTSQLASLGYTIVSASDGKAALETLKQHSDIKLVFADIVMPGGIDGVQLATKARNLRPGVKVLFTSGYTGDGKISKATVGRQALVLNKPYRLKDLAQKVRAAIDSGPIK